MYYFIGIKGTGMSALACILFDLGHDVKGSDLDKHFFTQNELEKRNIEMLSFSKENIQDNYTIIIGNAFDNEFEEVKAALANQTCKCYRYHEFLGEFMKNYCSISISGSHGKTTTSGICTSVLSEDFPCGYLIGDGTGHVAKDSKYLVVESCEYRRHFLAYFPDYLVITNIEIDHVDYFKDPDDYRLAYEEFVNNVKRAVVICGDDEECRKLKIKQKTIYYGLNDNNDLRANNIVYHHNYMEFDLFYENNFKYRFKIKLVGKHLLLNSLATIAIGMLNGMTYKEIEKGLNNYQGVKRRFVVEEVNNHIYIDDYAHHPTEVKVTIEAAKLRYPNKKIVAIFKPHRVSRVFYFADQFAAALKLADYVYLCDFTSIDDQEEGIEIDINYLQEKVPNSQVIDENETGARVLAQHKDVVYLFMSSKDIYNLKNKVIELQKL